MHPYRHWTAASDRQPPVGIDVFDDDPPGCVAIYCRFADDTLWPYRRVSGSDQARVETVVANAAAAYGGMRDHRTAVPPR